MNDTPRHQLRLAIAELVLEREEKTALHEAAAAEAHSPPRWRRVHSLLNRAAAAVGMREAHRT